MRGLSIKQKTITFCFTFETLNWILIQVSHFVFLFQFLLLIVILKFPTRKDSLFFSVISLHTKVQTIKLLKRFFSLILLKHIKVVYLKSEVFTSFLTNSSILDCPAYLQLQKSSRVFPQYIRQVDQNLDYLNN